jgi:hypothetical protein
MGVQMTLFVQEEKSRNEVCLHTYAGCIFVFGRRVRRRIKSSQHAETKGLSYCSLFNSRWFESGFSIS